MGGCGIRGRRDGADRWRRHRTLTWGGIWPPGPQRDRRNLDARGLFGHLMRRGGHRRGRLNGQVNPLTARACVGRNIRGRFAFRHGGDAVDDRGPLNRILLPATDARTVAGGRLPEINGPAGTAGGGSAGAFTGVIVEICPVRCRWTGTGMGVVSPIVSSTGAPVGRNGDTAARPVGGRTGPACVPAAVGTRALSSIAT